MKVSKEKIWTWYLPGQPRNIHHDDWVKKGGKWIVFDREERISELVQALELYIDAGYVVGAKSWNGDPSALNVYCPDHDRVRVKLLLDRVGAGHLRVWEYDYAWEKNISRPFEFAYSWSLKFMTILRSYGMIGSIKLMRDLMIPG